MSRTYKRTGKKNMKKNGTKKRMTKGRKMRGGFSLGSIFGSNPSTDATGKCKGRVYGERNCPLEEAQAEIAAAEANAAEKAAAEANANAAEKAAAAPTQQQQPAFTGVMTAGGKRRAKKSKKRGSRK